MNALSQLYGSSLATATDLYQLTMAYAAWKNGLTAREGVFELHFRKTPFEGGYAVAAGLESALDLLESYAFSESDLAYLATLQGSDGKALFEPAFLQWLGEQRLQIEIDAVDEGRVVFPYEPLLRVTGPIWQCQLLETPLLTLVNFQTLVATKAARIRTAARGASLLEFGLRRAQGLDGGVTASRAAYIGGMDATSNLLAGKLYGIPVRGTHAHSWVVSFDDEREAFMAYAKAMPNNAVFLVDTYNTLDGVRNAIEAGRWLRSQGHRMLGIRLDSGDLAYLSIEARKLLDEAGFRDTAILATNDLDEKLIASLLEQDAKVTVFGVGTKLVTSDGQPALGGVYKLTACRENSKALWENRIKLSEQVAKTSLPGVHQILRYSISGKPVADMICIEGGRTDEGFVIHPLDPTQRKRLPPEARAEALLRAVWRAGKRTRPAPSLHSIRERARAELDSLHPGIRRFTNPHSYPVGLSPELHELRQKMILERRGFAEKV